MHEVSNARPTASYNFHIAMDPSPHPCPQLETTNTKTGLQGTKNNNNNNNKTSIKPTNAATTIYQLQSTSASDLHRPTEQIPPVWIHQWSQTSRKLQKESTQNLPKWVLDAWGVWCNCFDPSGERAVWMRSSLRKRVGRVIFMDIAYNFQQPPTFWR